MVSIVLLLTGCGVFRPDGDTGAPSTPAPIPVGRSTQHISVDGTDRTFHLYRPATLPADAPLVVMLHGGFGSGAQAEQAYNWNAQADRGHFVVAYPDGLDRAWNTGGGCCGRPARNDVDDIAFISQLVATIDRGIPLDTDRIYATGMSNGGIMAYTLACRTTIFAAIGPVAGTQLGDCPSPAPTSIIHIHGTADEAVRYDGAEGQGVARIDGPAIPALNATWRDINGCAEPSTNTAGGVTTSTATCAEGRAVDLVTVADAGHQWPGAVPDLRAERILRTNPPSTALDATQAIWRFFTQHSR